jgi:hypothetical protein
MNVRPYLRGSLWAGALLLVILLVAGLLWLALAVLGDQPGSQGAKGVTLVATFCLVLDLIGMVVLLAVAELSRPERPANPPPLSHPAVQPPTPHPGHREGGGT